METILDAVQNEATSDYGNWIERVKALASKIGAHKWELGDLLVVGDDEFNAQNIGIPSYLLIGSHPPNYWKEVSDEVGLSVASLKQYANVARAFPTANRITELTWTHHLIAHRYVERDAYLRAALGGEDKPHTVRWLEEYIERMEGGAEPAEERRSISIDLPLPIVRKIRDLEKYYGVTAGDLLVNALTPALDAYLEKQREELSMKFFDFHDGETWPFREGADQLKAILKPERKSRRRRNLVQFQHHSRLGKIA